jgi:threonine aldolase
MVNVDVSALGIDAAAFARHLEAAGVRGLPGMASVLRFVTYRGITRNDIDRAIAAVRGVATARPWIGAPATA